MNESRATRYQRARRRARAAAAAAGLLLLALAALTPAGRAVALWAENTASTTPAPLRALLAIFLFVAVLVAAWEVALLAAVAMTARAPASAGGVPDQDSGRVVSHAFAAAMALPAALWCALAVQIGVWLWASAWWIPTAVILIGTLVGTMQVIPVMLMRWAGSSPLNRPALIERLGALARRLRVDIQSIEEVSSSSVTATALVAGTGESRRVFIASEIVRDWSDEEIAVVVAHEFGHHTHRDLWWTVALDAVLVAAGLAVAAVILRTSGIAPADLAALPAIGLTVWTVFIVATPLRHALSRWQERRADAFALELTGGAAGFRAALRRLAARHLVEERPSRLTRWLYHRHPTVAERLRVADQFERRTAGGAIDR